MNPSSIQCLHSSLRRTRIVVLDEAIVMAFALDTLLEISYLSERADQRDDKDFTNQTRVPLTLTDGSLVCSRCTEAGE